MKTSSQGAFLRSWACSISCKFSLALEYNNLTGGVPRALGNCSAFRALDLSSNELIGSIPAELGILDNIQALYLRGNRLTGRIPRALGNCTALTDLELYLNQLSGSIPAELGMLSELQFIFLYENNLTGGVPTALGNCTALLQIALELNELAGSIPAELGMLSKLQSLSLWYNNLTGGVPRALGNCTALLTLQLNSNQLSGTIPVELGLLGSLNWVTLYENDLSGSFPQTLGNCTALELFSVGDNFLSGVIPDVFGNLRSLDYIDLSYNVFSGHLPRSLVGLKQLSSVQLQENAFVGTIPQNFSTSLLLNYLDISTNNLSGSIPKNLGVLVGLVTLNFSHNLLSGQIPPNLGSLQELVALDLSYNELSGRIPSDLENCAELQYLNLSHNSLTGTLPSSFAGLLSLDLSYTQLDGSVPNMRPYNDTTLADLRGNPLLCGPIVKRSCNVSHQGTARNSSHLKLIVSVAIASVLAGLLIFGIVIWRHCIHSNPPVMSVRRKYLPVSVDELREATNGFSEANILGRGGVSTVYRAVLARPTVLSLLARPPVLSVAVKVLKTDHLTQTITEADVATLKREVEVLAMLRHRNIVKVLGCCFNLEMQAIILELMPNGNLDTYLHGTQRQNALSKEEKLRLLRGIAKGLEYLHHFHDQGRKIVHCDVKPANILLDEDWEPRISDFGIAKLLEQDVLQESASMLLRGSIGYIPPEYAFRAIASTAGDVYSFGVVMLEVLTGKRPTDVGNESGVAHDTLLSLVEAAYPYQLLRLFDTPGLTADEAVELAQMALSCTSHQPIQRPAMLHIAKFLEDMSNPGRNAHPYPPISQLAQGHQATSSA